MPPDIDVVIRPAEARDAAALGRLGALLMRVHYAFDPERFLAPGPNPEAGYGAFLRSQLAERDVVVLVAEREGEVVGYVYAGVEPLSWKELRARAGFIHDLVVDPRVRRAGLAKRLVGAAAEWLFAHGVPRVMLWTAAENEPAAAVHRARLSPDDDRDDARTAGVSVPTEIQGIGWPPRIAADARRGIPVRCPCRSGRTGLPYP